MRSDAWLGQVGRVGLADAMTIANGACGLAAIAVLLDLPSASAGWGPALVDGQLGIVLALVACGLTVDALDGAVARRRGSSGLGGHLDVMCDAVTFGVVPPLLLIQGSTAGGALGSAVTALVGGLYFVAILVRLAAYASAEDHHGGFVGLPCPGAAILVLSLLLLDPGEAVVLAGFAAAALLMVSSYRWPHMSPAGMVAASVLACGCIGAAFAGWISVGLAGALEGVFVFLIGPLGLALRRSLGTVASGGAARRGVVTARR